ncbi:hypothetical protein BFG57_13375 [Bacillus solimangrovi]|uniref:NodB homology domain-containing protein n=2 Tax=Bacillus solimangrovi TaxID=1305675 RepID=A0A1E5LGF3_9BACI|nr:hypothetical protein BFG57_13375 [Bacillus solimangrovi]
MCCQLKKEQPLRLTEPTVTVSPPENVVYLTFDDGPSESTEAILSLLKRYQARATFFMLSPAMEKYPEGMKRMVEEGHSFGLHGVSHNAKSFYESTSSILGELTEGNRVLERITGKQTMLIRTPYGSVPYMTKTYRQVVKEEGYLLWDWNIDSRDWEYKDVRYVQDTIYQLEQVVREGKVPVILLHDKKSTLDHLERLLVYLQNNGYVMEALNEHLSPIQFKS